MGKVSQGKERGVMKVITILEEQAKILESELDSIKNRLEEIKDVRRWQDAKRIW